MPLDLRNPVIEGYLSGLAIKRQREQDAVANALKEQEMAQMQQEQKLKEQQFQSYLKHLDFQEKTEQSRLEMEGKRLAQESAMHRFNAQRQVAQDVNSGVMRAPTQGEANSSPAGGFMVGDMQIDPRLLVSPEDKFKREMSQQQQMTPILAQRAGATAGAEAKATDPVKRGQMMLASELGMTEEDQKAKHALERQKLGIEGDKAVARIHGGFQLDAARIRQFTGLQDAAALEKAIMPFAMGESPRKLGSNTPDRLLATHLANAGFREFTAPEAAKLKEVHALDPLDALMEQFIKELPPDKMNAAGQLVTSKIPTTHLKAMQGRVASVAGNVSKTIGGESGRLTEDDINRAFGTLVGAGLTAAEARENLKFFAANRRSKVADQILGGMSEQQKLLLLKKYDFDPAKFGSEVKLKDGRKVPKYVQDKDGEWLVVNAKTGMAESVDK